MTRNKAAIVSLAGAAGILAFILYAWGVTTRTTSPDDSQIDAQAARLDDHGGRDTSRGFLPVLVHSEDDSWLLPVPVYATAALLAVVPHGSAYARWIAAACGAIDVMLLYALAIRRLRHPIVAVIAAVLLGVTPVHARFSSAASVEGIWPVPFILAWMVGMTGLTDPPTPQARWMLAASIALLAASAYTQPSAALMMPLFLAATIVRLWTTTGWRIRDALPALCALVLVLTPLLVWYARFPGTYPDTFGRWVLHPAHLRNPLVWLRALTNWQTDANVAALSWDFLAPSHLFLDPESRGLCGMFLSASVVPMAAGVYVLASGSTDDTPGALDLRWLIVTGGVVAIVAAAMFGHARSDARAVIVAPLGSLVAALGATTLWREGGVAGRAGVVMVATAAAVQAFFCL